MTLTLQRPLIVLDVETTGVDVEKDRVVSLAWATMDGVAHELRFNPGFPIPPEASAIHGITDDDVCDCPAFPGEAGRIAQAWHGADLAGFNLRSFDVPILRAEFRRAGFVDWPGADTRIVDAYRIYNRMEPRTLEAACRHYLGEELQNAHSAKADVEACVRVLQVQAKRYGASTLAELEALERDPSWVDAEGKFKRVNGVVIITIGQKWAGKPLAQVDTGFLEWMVGPKAKFADDTRAVVLAELARRRDHATEAFGQ